MVRYFLNEIIKDIGYCDGIISYARSDMLYIEARSYNSKKDLVEYDTIEINKEKLPELISFLQKEYEIYQRNKKRWEAKDEL